MGAGLIYLYPNTCLTVSVNNRQLILSLKILFAGILVAISTHAQNAHRVDGFLYDAETGQSIVGANVFIDQLKRGTTTDEDGRYRISVPEGTYTITYSFIGYETVTRQLVVNQDLSIDINLKPLMTTIQEVVISDRHAEDQLAETQTGYVAIDKREIENLPYLMGEADPLRIIQLMPGVHTAGEGNTGFYVRGGAIDQNLILLDNTIVYNPSHLFGFFSVFNGAAMSSMELHKSGIPSYYGGRLSSITKINTRKGDDENFKGEGGIGLIAANALIEGPIVKNKGSFLVAARRTYVDLFIDPIRELFSVEERLNYHFFDLNVNADYDLGSRDELRLRSYFGNDNFMFGTGSSFSNTMIWSNKTTSVQWLHRFGERVAAELSLFAASYDMDFSAGINQYRFNIISDIRDKGFNYQIDITGKRHHFTAGLTYTHHIMRPNNMDSHTEDVELDFGDKVTLYAEEGAAFVNDRITLSEKLELSAGLRVTAFSQLGPFTRYIEDNNFQILDTVTWKSGDRIKNYANVEPRVSMRYSLNPSSSLKLSYDRVYQYIHMAPLSSASLPLDMWVTSSSVVKPQSADQYSIGYFRNFSDNTFETSLVAYHKKMRRQLEYRDGVIIGYSKGFNYDDNFVFGDGVSSGVELMVRKNSGRLNGMFAYTLSRTLRTFPDLNQGEPFPAKYDRLHDLSAMANFVYNNHWTFSGVFVYGTGNALNLPIARYMIQGNVINEYGKRNSSRMPAYHRLDLAATYVARKTKKYETAWVFSVYNVYNRRNPYYIYFETKGDLQEYKLETKLKQVSLFPVLPSVTYRVKF